MGLTPDAVNNSTFTKLMAIKANAFFRFAVMFNVGKHGPSWKFDHCQQTGTL